MMLEQQLKQLAADAPEVVAEATVADVVRRGRMRLYAARLVGGLAAAAVVTAGIVTVPLMLEGPMPSPAVLDTDAVEDVVEQGGTDRGKDDIESPVHDDPAEQLQRGPLEVSFDVDVLILSPEPGFETEAAEVLVEGVVEPGAEVWVSGVPAMVEGETFRVLVPLEPGAQGLRAFARLGNDRVGVDEIVVVRKVVATSEPAHGKEPVDDGKAPHDKPQHDGTEFTAIQTSDHVEGEPPVGTYEGTAPAGSWVKVWSKYGWSKQQVGASGEWRIEVAFHDAPVGTHTWSVEAWLLDTTEKRYFELTGTRHEGEAAGHFTAIQVHDHVEGEPPVGLYEGSGPAGAWVKAWSKYGWAKTQIDPSGQWRIEVALQEAPSGTHTFAVEVWLLDTSQREWFELTTTRSGSEATAFTANQARGSSDASPPTEVFWGTAQPGTKILVESKYGSIKVIVPDNGEWVAEVTFHDAPVGEPFPVEVHSVHAQDSIWFEFERIS